MSFQSAAYLGFGLSQHRPSPPCPRSNSKPEAGDEIACRICQEEDGGLIISPCRCKGTLARVHVKCLEEWLAESGRDSCELCGERYNLERTLLYGFLEGLAIWIFTANTRRGMLLIQSRSIFKDLILSCIFNTFILSVLYICIVMMDLYTKEQYKKFTPIHIGTLVGIFTLCILVYSSYNWTKSIITYHCSLWYYWWQHNVTVRILSPDVLPKRRNTVRNIGNKQHIQTALNQMRSRSRPHEQDFYIDMNDSLSARDESLINVFSDMEWSTDSQENLRNFEARSRYSIDSGDLEAFFNQHQPATGQEVEEEEFPQ